MNTNLSFDLYSKIYQIELRAIKKLVKVTRIQKSYSIFVILSKIALNLSMEQIYGQLGWFSAKKSAKNYKISISF